MNDDERHLARAVELARETMQRRHGGPFGAVVVLGGDVVGEGANRVLATNDPTAHAEVTAIRDACARLGTFSLGGGVIYSSSEPCPMCLASIYWARLDRLVFANDKSVASRAGFDDTFFYEELAKSAGERTLETRHARVAGAEALFEEWVGMPDKTQY